MLIAALAGLDFFTWIEPGPRTIDEIARHFGAASPPGGRDDDALCRPGPARPRGRTRCSSPSTAREHLVASSPWFLGPYFPKLADRPIARDLLGVLRTDQPAHFASREDQSDWHRAMEAEGFAEEFTAAMDCRGLLLGQALAARLDLGNHQRLLDIAGGSAIYACSLAARYPAPERVGAGEAAGGPDRRARHRGARLRRCACRSSAGDMLDGPLPGGHDVHLFSNVLHDWDETVVERLLHASARALPAGGLIVVHEAFLNADKTGPLPSPGTPSC